MRRNKITETMSLTRTVSKRNEMPMINGMCTISGCNKYIFFKEAMSKNPGKKEEVLY